MCTSAFKSLVYWLTVSSDVKTGLPCFGPSVNDYFVVEKQQLLKPHIAVPYSLTPPLLKLRYLITFKPTRIIQCSVI